MKLIEALEIVKRSGARQGDSQSFFLACGFMPLHLRTFLQVHLLLRYPVTGVKVPVGLYGDLAGNLERARVSAPAATAVVIEWPDLDPRVGLRELGGWRPEVLPDILRSVDAMRERLQTGLAELAKVCPVALCLPTLALPPVAFTGGWEESWFEIELERQVAGLGAWAACQPRIRVLNRARLDAVSPPAERRDVRAELQTGFPYRMGHAEALAGLLATLIENPQPKKGLITDLDDTLWRGILGEVGVDGVEWDLASHSQVHGIYQQFLDALAGRGVLIAVASKNAPALAEEALDRADLRIARDRMYPLEVHWGQKSESVRRILKTWNIGADAVVCVDDSPMDLAEVQAAHPQMECVLFPKDDPAKVIELLEHLRDAFGKTAVSEEDRIRGESIRQAGTLREAAREGGSSLDDFLAQAEAEVVVRWGGHSTYARAFELVNKTNQFNLNGRRYTEAEWQWYLGQADAFLMTVSYRDKFGPLGGIAVILGRLYGREVGIDTWVMSCRAFARRIEHQCLRRLFDKFDAATLLLDFQPTPRNGPLQEFLASVGVSGPGFRISGERFRAVCPPLFHSVSEAGQ